MISSRHKHSTQSRLLLVIIASFLALAAIAQPKLSPDDFSSQKRKQ